MRVQPRVIAALLTMIKRGTNPSVHGGKMGEQKAVYPWTWRQ